MIRADVGCGRPFSWLRKRVALVFSFVPDFDEGVFRGWIGGDVDERWSWTTVRMYLGTLVWAVFVYHDGLTQ
jgi:hypothetical protein